MKTVFKTMAVLAVCVFTFVAIGTICSEMKFEPTETINAKVILPEPVRKGHRYEGVFIG